MRRTAAGFTLLEAIFVLVVLGLLALLLGPVLVRCNHCGGNLVKCGSNLSQIAKAAYQYSVDWHLYPHVSPKGLDGGPSTDVSSRCMRSLVWHELVLDNCETFVCPSSPDQATPMPDHAKFDGRTWTWGQATDSTVVLPSPIVAGSGDPTLVTQTALSYGWTMRQVTHNSGSGTLLAADKARMPWDETKGLVASTTHTGNMIGNHKDAILAVTLDSHIRRVTPSSPDINSSNIGSTPIPGADGGSLGVLNDDLPGS